MVMLKAGGYVGREFGDVVHSSMPFMLNFWLDMAATKASSILLMDFRCSVFMRISERLAPRTAYSLDNVTLRRR